MGGEVRAVAVQCYVHTQLTQCACSELRVDRGDQTVFSAMHEKQRGVCVDFLNEQVRHELAERS